MSPVRPVAARAAASMGRLARLSVALPLAVAINLLLFQFMQWIVDPRERLLPRVEEVQMVEFVRLMRQEQRREAERERELPKPPPPQVKPPESPPPEPEQAARPVQAPLEMPLPDIDLPMNISGGPYLGDYRPNVVERSEPVSPAPGPAPGPAAPAFDAAAVPVYRVPPVYPTRAQRAGIEGQVVVELTIGPDGAVTEARVVEASPPQVFDEAALKAARKWRFEPKRADGAPVSWMARQTISFKMKK